MTTADPLDRPRRRSSFASWYASVREALDRPLTAYYLLLGASALLLTIGLIMVLSASSVRSYLTYDDSYAVVKRQLLWVAIGLPAAWVAYRMPIKHVRRLAYPGFVFALVLLALVARFGVLINGNKNWLAVGPFTMQPAEVAKLAIVLWAANIYAHKERRLGELHHLLVPVVPGLLAVIALVLVGRDLGTAMVLGVIMLGMLWVVGAPMRLFALSISVLGAAAAALAAMDPERLQRITHFTDPFKDYTDTGWQPAHGLYALSSGGWFGQGIGASTQKWGDLPEAHTDMMFAVVGEEVLVGLPAGTHVLIMTHDHAEDFALCDAALRMVADAPDRLTEVGLIGSSAKWARFKVQLRAAGHDDAALSRIQCPIGLPELVGKEPAVIAVGVAAALLGSLSRAAAVRRSPARGLA